MENTNKMIDDINKLSKNKGFPKASQIWKSYCYYNDNFHIYRYCVEKHLKGSETIKLFIVLEKRSGFISDNWSIYSKQEVPLNFDINNWKYYIDNNKDKEGYVRGWNPYY